MMQITSPSHRKLLVEDVDYTAVSRAYGIGTASGVRVVRYDITTPGGFGTHAEDGIHQLSWAVDSTLAAFVGDHHWILPPARAIWIPSGAEHDVAAVEPCTLVCLYVNAELAPVDRTEPAVVVVDDLVRGLVDHLLGELTDEEGRRAQSVLLDALSRRWGHSLALLLPRDGRVRRVARRIIADPTSPPTLEEVARSVGVSEKTVSRRFVRDTGLTYRAWLTRCRLHASLDPLLRGEHVAVVADAVGYRSTTGFINAFREQFGTTPAAYRAGGGLPAAPAPGRGADPPKG